MVSKVYLMHLLQIICYFFPLVAITQLPSTSVLVKQRLYNILVLLVHYSLDIHECVRMCGLQLLGEQCINKSIFIYFK